jgi:predicted peptidase
MSILPLLLTSALTALPPKQELIFPKGFVELFQACEYRRTTGDAPAETYRYRIFVPRLPKPGETYPLLLWLHGAGEAGSDNRENLRWLDLILNDRDHIEKYRFFILAVQYPNEGCVDMPSVTYEILQKTLREQPVDEDRIYLSGVSSGGGECWQLLRRHPHTFAAMAPLASGSPDISDAAAFVDIPIWVFHNVYDTNTSPAGVKAMVAAINAAGGNAYLTLLDAGGHDCWQQAFGRYDVMAWMLDQRRSAWVSWTPPGSRAWRWWHVFAVPCGFLALLVVGCWSERRRREHRRARAATVRGSNTTHEA